MSKQCKKCNEVKPLNDFYKDAKAKDGKISACKVCKNLARVIYKKNNPDKVKESSNKYYNKHRKSIREYQNNYCKNNRHIFNSKGAKRHASKLQATPKWLTKEQIEEIKIIYKNCPKGYHVDHIVPLQGKTVRGMHVPWNL